MIDLFCCKADSTCDIFGLLVGDTTGQHKSHLFDLNCKICTGKQKSEEDLMKKVVKVLFSAKSGLL